MTQSQVLPIDWSDGIGLNDSAEGRLLIAPDAAYPIHHEADEIMTQAWFSVKQDDAIDGKSVVYEYAKDGSNRMLWRNAGQEPTPGKLLYAQVPNVPVNVKCSILSKSTIIP